MRFNLFIVWFIFQGFDFYRQRREKYGHVYKTHVLGKPTIRVWGNENIRKVLKNEETLVTMAWPTSVTNIMGRGGLVTSTRKLHSARRAAIMKAFTNSAINGKKSSQILQLQFQRYLYQQFQQSINMVQYRPNIPMSGIDLRANCPLLHKWALYSSLLLFNLT